jgi:hypothetical protein
LDPIHQHTFYAGGHPTSILADDAHAGFNVTTTVELFAAIAGSGTLTAIGSWPGAVAVSKAVTLVAGAYANATLAMGSGQTKGVRLWHPRGHGDQPLYNLTVTYIPSGHEHENADDPDPPQAAALTTAARRRIGFRHVALVTINDTDAATRASAAAQDGTGQLTMFFRVNGAPVYARGGNKIPMDLLDGRLSAEAHRRLVQSAVEGNMNTLRVWGGGIWEPRAFWDAADELGVLLYTDMQFTWRSVLGTETERAEMRYQLRRLSHHPSVVLWDACNECGGGGLYDSFVMPEVAALDSSRPIWPSCPSPGWMSGVDRLSSRPNGRTLKMGAGGDPRPAGFPFPQESHGPYTAFMKDSMEGVTMPKALPVGSMTDPRTAPALTGAEYEGWYKSEFGAVSWSSFESMSAQMPSDQWSMASNGAKTRNWNASNVIAKFFGPTAAVNMGRSGETAFKKQLYQSMIGQQLFLKTEIEAWRSQNLWGSTIWMCE